MELPGVASRRIGAGRIGCDDDAVELARGVVRIVARQQGLVNVIPAIVLPPLAVLLELDVDCPVGGGCHALESVVGGDGNPVEGLGEIRHSDVRGIVDGQLAGGSCGTPVGEGLAFHGRGHGVGVTILGARLALDVGICPRGRRVGTIYKRSGAVHGELPRCAVPLVACVIKRDGGGPIGREVDGTAFELDNAGIHLHPAGAIGLRGVVVAVVVGGAVHRDVCRVLFSVLNRKVEVEVAILVRLDVIGEVLRDAIGLHVDLRLLVRPVRDDKLHAIDVGAHILAVAAVAPRRVHLRLDGTSQDADLARILVAQGVDARCQDRAAGDCDPGVARGLAGADGTRGDVPAIDQDLAVEFAVIGVAVVVVGTDVARVDRPSAYGDVSAHVSILASSDAGCAAATVGSHVTAVDGDVADLSCDPVLGSAWSSDARGIVAAGCRDRASRDLYRIDVAAIP